MMTDSSSGIIKFSSPWSFRETVERIEAVLDAKLSSLPASISPRKLRLSD
jgi:hypothetical protein